MRSMKAFPLTLFAMCLIFGAITLLLAPVASAIKLGDKEVPREKFVVYLFIGHSNMMGVDRGGAKYDDHPRVWAYRWYADKRWVSAKKDGRAISPRGTGGPAMPFLTAMAEKHKDYHFGAIHNGSSAAMAMSLRRGASNRYARGAQLHREIVDSARHVREHATLGGIVAMLGIVEHLNMDDSKRFGDDLTQVITDLRRDIGMPDLPLIISDYEMESTGRCDPRSDRAQEIIKQLRIAQKKLKHMVIVDTCGIDMHDDHHFTAKGHQTWAKRAVDDLHENKWFPPHRFGLYQPDTRHNETGNDPQRRFWHWPKMPAQLVFQWEDGQARNRVEDPRTKQAYDIKVQPHGEAIYGRHFEMDLADGSFAATDIEDELIYGAATRTGKLTVAALIESDDDRQYGHIISFSNREGETNFAISQRRQSLHFQIRTSHTGEGRSAEIGLMQNQRPIDVVATYDGKTVRCYINGHLTVQRHDIHGDFRNWASCQLVLGHDRRGKGDWHGKLSRVEIHSDALDDNAIRARHTQIRKALSKRKRAPRIEIDAELVARSTPAQLDGMYGRSLIVYRYKVTRVHDGKYEEKTVQVAHWSGLNGQPAQRILKRKIGETYRLELEPFQTHPQLASERIADDERDAKAALWYDVGPRG